MKRPRAYIAGKYTQGDTAENIRLAQAANAKLLKMGFAPFCPHANFANMEDTEGLDYEDFLAADFAWLECADVIYMLEGWEDSPGARREHGFVIQMLFASTEIVYQEADDADKVLREIVREHND